MRMMNFIEAVLFTVAFLMVLLVILTDRSAQRAPARRAASTSSRRGIDGCAPDLVQARLAAAEATPSASASARPSTRAAAR